MPRVDRECITHHMACDCREALYAERVRTLEAERDVLAARVADLGQGLKYAEELSAHDKRCRDLAEARVRELEPALLNLIATLDTLMAESNGVSGLHKNGDVATWAEIGEGGAYESWLGVDLGRAREVFAALGKAGER